MSEIIITITHNPKQPNTVEELLDSVNNQTTKYNFCFDNITLISNKKIIRVIPETLEIEYLN